MLLEVNELKNLIVDRPRREGIDTWIRIARCVPLVVLSSNAARADWWRERLPNRSIVLERNDSYINDIAGNIRDALRRVDAQPCDAAYVTANPRFLEEAINTHVGTILAAPGVGSTLPDWFFSGVDKDLERAITETVRGKQEHGYINEVYTTRLGGGTLPSSVGWVMRQHYLRGREELDPEIADHLAVFLAGRYFPETDARHAKHQFSLRLLLAKRGAHPGEVVANALGDTISLISGEGFDLITRVPPKLNKPDDHLGKLLRTSLGFADRNREEKLSPFLDLRAIRCAKSYGQQKMAGSYIKRVANVRGAFIADARRVEGKKILLVDDILTSGATIVEATRSLVRAGAAEVVALPIAINQGVINYDASLELPCSAEKCRGSMRIRFARDTHGSFWGCDHWKPHGEGCGEMLTFAEGIEATNKLAKRRDITVWTDGTF